jgi:Leucine-rich repeat (LRR) protein
MKSYRLLLSAIAICISAQNSQDPILEQDVERKILIAIFQYTSGESWLEKENWNNPNVNYCDWYGIQCVDVQSASRRKLDNGQKSIESIDLAENNLKGSVPISLLLLLPNIKNVKLNGNDVDYTMVPEQESEILGQVLDLPISVQSNVRSFDVSQTSVKEIDRLFSTGNGNTEIQMPYLIAFFASDCSIRGSFPEFFTQFISLERIALDHNDLTGTLPSTLGNLRKLKYLSLADNNLSGTLPGTFLSLAKLSYLILEHNKFTGTIPIALTSGEYTPLLEELDLSNQRDESTPPGPQSGLSGRLPSFSSFKRLHRIDLGVNSLTGAIPLNLLSETNVNEFDYVILSSNSITGSVPSSVVSRIPAESLFLDDNKITALSFCPQTEFGCASLMCPPGTYEPRAGRQEERNRICLDCSLNTKYWGQKFCRLEEGASTPAPVSVTTSPSVSPMSPPSTSQPSFVPYPTRSPTESPSIGKPIEDVNEKAILEEFYVSTGGDGWVNSNGWNSPNSGDTFCNWYGIVCVSDDLESVKYLNMDSNKLVGQIPESIYKLPNLVSLDLSQNEGLTVTFGSIGQARSLDSIEVSKTIIPSLAQIIDIAPRLQELHMNDIDELRRKPFPTEIIALTNLKQLSFDYNDVTGRLPSDLGSLSKLMIFSASNNLLSGSIPTSISQMSDLANLRLSSNHLSGAIPKGLEDMKSLSILDLSNQWSNGVDDDYLESGKPGLSGPLPSFSNLTVLQRLDLGVNSFSGTLPDDFLQNVDTENLFDFADLSDNFLTGTVPSGVSHLPNLDLHDNFFDAISKEVCDLKAFGCDGVLCRPGTFNKQGRQTTKDNPCKTCSNVNGRKYYGATECQGNVSEVSSTPTDSPTKNNFPISIDRTALELIYESCGGIGWASKDNWMDETVSVCLWDGVFCDENNSVSEISLRSNLLNGTFPSMEVFLSIPSLKTIVLDSNTVVFPFEGIQNATSLETLDLTGTELSSLSGLGAAPSLANLYLSSNNLKGSISNEILLMTTLRRLALAFNDITGSIPSALATLTNLEFLSLHDNDITGTIPSELGQLSRLMFLILESNNLRGSIPTQLNSLTNLGFITIADQRGDNGKGISGRLPSFSGLKSLKKLDFSDNHLSGTIPSDFLASIPIQSFQYLSLANNRLEGELPNSLSKISVEKYNVTDNEITKIGDGLCSRDLGGMIEKYGCNAVLCPIGTWNSFGRQLNDDEVCETCLSNPFFGATQCDVPDPTLPPVSTSSLSEEAILDLFFEGTRGSSWKRKDRWRQRGISICDWYGVRCDIDGNNVVEHIVLSANNLVGTVPNEIFLLPYLKSLVLDSNNVLLSFKSINSARRLELVDVSATAIEDLTGIGGASTLRELHLKAIGLEGSIPDEIFELLALEQIDFDFNSFKGPLDHRIGKLSNLKQLSGEKNMLSGVLPDELRFLTNLESLRLSKNSLSGNLPADALSEMTSLIYVDLSHQSEHGGLGLSGPLPSFSNLRQLVQLRLKQNALSGTVPFNFLQDVDSSSFEYADLSSNLLTGTLPVSLSSLDSIFLQDNMISDIPDAFCDTSRGSLYAQFNCSAFLCAPGTYNEHGRQESPEMPCEQCSTSKYFGSIDCKPGDDNSTQSIIDEKSILVQLFNTCGGKSWDEKSNWLEDSISICQWQGVKCSAGAGDTVEAIELGGNNLRGIPPTAIFTLPNLKSLSFYSNPLTAFNFEGIENARKLNEIFLDATGISSVQGIEKAPNLKILNLRFNEFHGKFPTELTQLSRLQTLTMAYNSLTGSLLSSIERMTNLQTLLLSHNQLSGELQSVNFPSSIRRLDLSNNKLTGSISDAFLTLLPFSAKLQIDLSSNQLSGSIPTALTRFTNLNIYLEDNKLSALNQDLCLMKGWNDGDVGRFGCNGILCPIGQSSPNGRQSSRGDCYQCESGGSRYLGSSNCTITQNSHATKLSTTKIVTLAVFAIVILANF